MTRIPPAPSLTMTEARVLYDWLRGAPYPKDHYDTARAALGKLKTISETKEDAK